MFRSPLILSCGGEHRSEDPLGKSCFSGSDEELKKSWMQMIANLCDSSSPRDHVFDYSFFFFVFLSLLRDVKHLEVQLR